MSEQSRQAYIESYGEELTDLASKIHRRLPQNEMSYGDLIYAIFDYAEGVAISEVQRCLEAAERRAKAECKQDADGWGEGFVSGWRKGWYAGARGQESTPPPLVKLGPGGDFTTEVKL